MKSVLCPIAGFAFLACMAAPASGGVSSDVKLSLHTQLRTKKVTQTCGSAAPTAVPCSQHNVSGSIETQYHVYLVVARVDPSEGIGGVTVGVDYGEGVHVEGWSLCADLYFDRGSWPAAGSGARIIWSHLAHCQRSTVPGHEEEGVHAIAAALYVYAYSPGDLFLTVNTAGLPQPELAIMNCSAMEVALDPEVLPLVRFSASGTEPGVSPCALDPVPIQETSWGRLKHRLQ